jgi:hypothetical protein
MYIYVFSKKKLVTREKTEKGTKQGKLFSEKHYTLRISEKRYQDQ